MDNYAHGAEDHRCDSCRKPCAFYKYALAQGSPEKPAVSVFCTYCRVCVCCQCVPLGRVHECNPTGIYKKTLEDLQRAKKQVRVLQKKRKVLEDKILDAMIECERCQIRADQAALKAVF